MFCLKKLNTLLGIFDSPVIGSKISRSLDVVDINKMALSVKKDKVIGKKINRSFK